MIEYYFELVADTFVYLKLKQICALEDLDGIDTESENNL